MLGEASRVLFQVFKSTGGLVWKHHPMNHTRRANAKKRHRRLRHIEEILRVSKELPAPIGLPQAATPVSQSGSTSAAERAAAAVAARAATRESVKEAVASSG